MSEKWKITNGFCKKNGKGAASALAVLLSLMLAVTAPGQILAEELATTDAPKSISADIPELESAASWVHITKTKIHADSVFNTEGYGSLVIQGDDSGQEDDSEMEEWEKWIPTQIALIDRNGIFYFPYQADPVGDYFGGDARFRCSDGIVSLTLGNPYFWAGTPLYYYLDGSSAFVFETTEQEYTDDETGHRWREEVSYLGGPLTDGYAVVVKRKDLSRLDNYLAGGPPTSEYVTYIVDEDGTVVCELPSEDNEELGLGASGFTTRKLLGQFGEGLIGYLKYTEGGYNGAYFYLTVAEVGYMDPSGQTVINLTGQGYTNVSSFRNGLAAVRSQEGKYGFIDKTGALVIPCAYDNFYSFGDDGLCAVKKDGKWGYIDKSGSTVIPFEYDVAFGAENRLAVVGKDGKYGFVNYANHVVVPLVFDDISTCENGVAYAIKDGIVYIITPDDAISIKECKVKSISKKAYTGKEITPALTITYKGEKLVQGIDYTVKYSNNKKTGRATATINGVGAYAGTVKKTFDIVPAKVTGVKITSNKSKTMTVTWKKDTMASGYVIEYSTDSAIKKNVGKVTVGKNTTISKEIRKLKSQKTYYVRIRAYKIINGKKRYGKYSSIVKVAVK